MRILVACEFSGIVREAFREKGHEAWSCDLLPTELPGPHIQDDVRNYLGPCRPNNYKKWDVLIAHPPCTFLARVGVQYMIRPGRAEQQALAIEFFQLFQNCDIERKCIENPYPMRRVTDKIGRWTQVVQPWYFGDEKNKGVYLWLYNLPALVHHKENNLFGKKTHTGKGDILVSSTGRRHSKWLSNCKGKHRSRFFPGIAAAMADQWTYL